MFFSFLFFVFFAVFHKKWRTVHHLPMLCKATPAAMYICSNNTICRLNRWCTSIRYVTRCMVDIKQLYKHCTKKVQFAIMTCWSGRAHKMRKYNSRIHFSRSPFCLNARKISNELSSRVRERERGRQGERGDNVYCYPNSKTIISRKSIHTMLDLFCICYIHIRIE